MDSVFNERHDDLQDLINSSFSLGEKAGRLKNLNPVKDAEIARLKARIEELEAQQAVVGHKNPSWEAGAQWGLYTMPDEIALAYANLSELDQGSNDLPYDKLKELYDIVGGVMTGAIRSRK